MKLGLHLSNFTYGVPTAELAAKLTEIVVGGEAAGFDRLSVMDHYFQIPHVGPVDSEMFEAYSILGSHPDLRADVERRQWPLHGQALSAQGDALLPAAAPAAPSPYPRGRQRREEDPAAPTRTVPRGCSRSSASTVSGRAGTTPPSRRRWSLALIRAPAASEQTRRSSGWAGSPRSACRRRWGTWWAVRTRASWKRWPRRSSRNSNDIARQPRRGGPRNACHR